MRNTTEGRLGLWAAMLGLAGAGAVMIWPTHTEIGWTLMAIAALGGSGLVMHRAWETVDAWKHARTAAEIGAPKTAERVSPISVLIECMPGPPSLKYRPEGLMHAMHIMAIGNQGDLDLGSLLGPPGASILEHAGDICRCDITNLGKEPVFDVRFHFQVSISELQLCQNNPDMLMLGNNISSWIRSVRIPALVPGQPFTFYTVNTSPLVAQVIAPRTAQVGVLDGHFRDVHLVEGRSRSMTMFPSTTDPQVSRPLSPEPPEPTEGK